METDYEPYELVAVLGGFKLVDCESYERQYRRPRGIRLSPGYYVVYWPEWVRIRRFNENAEFFGPFCDRASAQAALTAFAALPVGSNDHWPLAQTVEEVRVSV